MIDAYIVVREEKHIDDKFWVCLSRTDAEKIARDVIEYWKKGYEVEKRDLEADQTLYGDLLLHYDVSDYFRVYMQRQSIREIDESGE